MAAGVLIDLSGVLYEGDTPVAGSAEALGRLRSSRLPVRFLTNTTRTPKRQLLLKLRRLGFDVAADEVFTPAAAACDWLARNRRRAHLLIHPDLAEDFEAAPDNGPTAVVLGDAGEFFDYARLNAAFRELVAGAPFLALAANRVFRDADGALSLDAGAFVKALEFASGTEAVVLGKPSPAFFQAALASMGVAAEDAAMIGDDAEADVAGALAAGFGAGYLVRTGKYRTGDEDRVDLRPSAVVDDFSAAVDALLRG